MPKKGKGKSRNIGRRVANTVVRATLIPYGIATYKELKSVQWFTYWETIRVTSFVIFFSVLTATFVYGVDQIVSNLFKLVIK